MSRFTSIGPIRCIIFINIIITHTPILNEMKLEVENSVVKYCMQTSVDDEDNV